MVIYILMGAKIRNVFEKIKRLQIFLKEIFQFLLLFQEIILVSGLVLSQSKDIRNYAYLVILET